MNTNDLYDKNNINNSMIYHWIYIIKIFRNKSKDSLLSAAGCHHGH